MQIKKDKVKKLLLDAAQQEFLSKGFKSASIRSIVKCANTTIGNFYNYFDSKEVIFSALVDDVYNDFIKFIQHHHEPDNGLKLLKAMNPKLLKVIISTYVKPIIPKLNDSFLLLIEYSEDTKYANAKNELIDFLGHHFCEHIHTFAPKYKNIEMGMIISRQFIEGIIEIIKTYKDEKQRKQLITEQLLYTSLGVVGLLQGG